MKLRLSILLFAAALAAAPAAGQTVKSLGYNTTNGNIVAATNVTFTNSVGFATNARAATRTNLGATTVGNSVFTATNAAAAATAIGLGATNEVTFGRVGVGGAVISTNSFSGGDFAVTAGYALTFISGGVASTTRTNLGLGATWLTNTDVTNFRTAIGLGATNNVTFNQLTATGNVTLNGSDNLMPNATNAASASSLMTRDLVAQRLPFQLLNYDPVTSAMGAVTSSNGGSGTPSVNKFDLRGGTNTNGVAVWGAGSGGGLGIKSSSRGNVGWQGRVSVGWSISRILTNSEVRLQFGKDSSDRNFSALGARGVGIYISNSSVFFETHDGTNHFQTTNSLTTSGDSQNDSWMAVTSNGVASFYKNGTLITNVTNNVPNSQSASSAFGYVIGVQNTTTNNSGIRIFTTPGFILQD